MADTKNGQDLPHVYLAPAVNIDAAHEEDGIAVVDRLSLYEVSLTRTHADPHVPPIEREEG